MKKLLFCLGVFIFMASMMPIKAQSIIDANDEHNFSDFYEKSLAKGNRAIPYAFLRESDVVWKTCVWRKIDMREKFNQYLYFPIDPKENTQGRMNLANLLYQAVSNGEIEVFEDDELKVPLDWEVLNGRLNKYHTFMTDDVLNEYGDVVEEGHLDSTLMSFNAKDYFVILLKEFWYIDKQDTRQKVRITGLSLVLTECKDRDGESICNQIPQFWVPMDDMRVRNILAKTDSYDENNIAANRSYDDIFIDRFFDSYVTRTTNRFNREVSSYLTGTDAILESQRLEDEIFNIESDMWEY